MLQIQQKVHRKKYDSSFINWNQFIILPLPNRSGSHDSGNFSRERKRQMRRVGVVLKLFKKTLSLNGSSPSLIIEREDERKNQELTMTLKETKNTSSKFGRD